MASERAESRLENLEAIEPLLSSLRVMSLSSLQFALNRHLNLMEYARRFAQILWYLENSSPSRENQSKKPELLPLNKAPAPDLLVVIGSAQGICGAYNRTLAEMASQWTTDHASQPVSISAFGSRLNSHLKQQRVDHNAHEALSSGSMPKYELASSLMRQWQEQFQQGRIASLLILSYQQVQDSSAYRPTLMRLLPDQPPSAGEQSETTEAWPQPIIEGSRQSLIDQIGEHLVSIRFYQLLLEAIAAENKIRYQLLEEAKETTSGLVEELSLEIIMEKRKADTQQMQELVTGAGMLLKR